MIKNTLKQTLNVDINSVFSPLLISVTVLCFIFSTSFVAHAEYERNKAVPVEKVEFGRVTSVRNITQTELIKDQKQGWKVFGGALIGGVIGNQFSHVFSNRGYNRSFRSISTVLGALIGGSIANENNQKYQEQTLKLVELMIKIDTGKEYMVIQDFDDSMVFQKGDAVRVIYMENGFVRIDKDF